jgi:hypothetical protein
MMLSRRHAMEDVNYTKVVPNRFIVEVNQDIYERYYRAIQKQVIRQWGDKLVSRLKTTNSRYGKVEFRLAGPVQIELRPAEGLQPFQARLLARIDADLGGDQTAPMVVGPCLELLASGERYALQPGITTLGRDESNHITLREQEVQEKRLISGQHAYIRQVDGTYRIHDGSIQGRPSVNGTYVNFRRVPVEGRALQQGDTIILASVDPNQPSAETPGVGVFRFYVQCP